MNTEETNGTKDIDSKEGFALLLDSSYPLLQYLREKCPGTYKHSQGLASMIEGISLAVGLDVNFMKVCATYHDIGKTVNPKFFTENQLQDEDPHADLDPWISYQFITRHVGDGVEILLNDHNFPREVIEIISQHHGTNVVKYFYSKSGNKDVDKYRHTGSKPSCVESAVLMIADHVEATARSKVQSGNFDPYDVIELTITGLIDDGQLDEVMIRLGDLKKIKAALAKELEGLYQKRVNYDKAKEEAKEGEE
jgi:putative nucleotidyltransferase with HDIG domain